MFNSVFAAPRPIPSWPLDIPGARGSVLPGQNRAITMAVALSLAIHALLLAIHFRFPDHALNKQRDNQLDIVLVNSKSARKPLDAQAKAQANLDGGGNTDENRRAKTPLPASRNVQPGDSLLETQRRVQEMEIQQQKLLTQAKSKRSVSTQPRPSEKQSEPQPSVSGVDLAQTAFAIARLQAEIDKNVDAYNKRPRRKEITARTVGVSYAWYFRDWQRKIERIGSLNYPIAAKDREYSLIITVSVRDDGSVEKIDIDHPSGNREVDQRAVRIVEMAQPFARFTPEMRAEYQIFDIVTTWTFTPGGAMTAEFRK